MDLREALAALAVALGAGLIIGAERQQAQAGRERRDLGGIRTFPLVALVGAVGGLLRPVAGAWFLATLLAGLAAVLAISYLRHPPDERGLTTEIAAFLTFVLGTLAATPELMPNPDRFLLVAATASVVMAILALKTPLHGFVSKVSTDDVLATVKFVVLALVVLPILPNRAYGPLDVLNPFRIGLMVVLVAAVSFAGYVAARLVGGKRGFLATGVLGGLVSSTAVTMTFSGRAKEDPALVGPSAIAILAASGTMFARIAVVVSIADRTLLASLGAPMAAMAIVAWAAAGLLYRVGFRDSGQQEVPLRNPFELRRAIQFGLLYAVVLLVAKAAKVYLGTRGLYGSAALAGLTDVDAITLSAAHLHRAGLEARIASTAIVIAAATNTVVKAGLALVLGGVGLARRVGPGLAAALVVGGLVLWIA